MPKTKQQADVSWIDDNLLDALAWQESRHKPKAKNTRSGAAGMYQWMPKFYKGAEIGFGVDKGAFDPYDPIESRKRTRQYLIGIQKHHPEWDPTDVLRAYNWGVGNVRKHKAGTRKDIPEEALNYPSLVITHAVEQPWMPKVSREELLGSLDTLFPTGL